MNDPLLRIGAGLIALGMVAALLWGPKSPARSVDDLTPLLPYAAIQGIGWVMVLVHYATVKKAKAANAKPKALWQLDVKRLTITGWILAIGSSIVGVLMMFAGMQLTAEMGLAPPLVLGTMFTGLFLGFASTLLLGHVLLSQFGLVILKPEE